MGAWPLCPLAGFTQRVGVVLEGVGLAGTIVLTPCGLSSWTSSECGWLSDQPVRVERARMLKPRAQTVSETANRHAQKEGQIAMAIFVNCPHST